MSSRVENQLKNIEMSIRKIKEEGVAIVNCGWSR